MQSAKWNISSDHGVHDGGKGTRYIANPKEQKAKASVAKASYGLQPEAQSLPQRTISLKDSMRWILSSLASGSYRFGRRNIHP